MSTKIGYITQLESNLKHNGIKPDMVTDSKVDGPFLVLEWERAGNAQKPLNIVFGSKDIAKSAQAHLRASQTTPQNTVRGGQVIHALTRDLSR